MPLQTNLNIPQENVIDSVDPITGQTRRDYLPNAQGLQLGPCTHINLWSGDHIPGEPHVQTVLDGAEGTVITGGFYGIDSGISNPASRQQVHERIARMQADVARWTRRGPSHTVTFSGNIGPNGIVVTESGVVVDERVLEDIAASSSSNNNFSGTKDFQPPLRAHGGPTSKESTKESGEGDTREEVDETRATGESSKC